MAFLPYPDVKGPAGPAATVQQQAQNPGKLAAIKMFLDKLMSDPVNRQTGMALGTGLMRDPQPYQSDIDLISQSIQGAMGVNQQLKNQRAEEMTRAERTAIAADRNTIAREQMGQQKGQADANIGLKKSQLEADEAHRKHLLELRQKEVDIMQSRYRHDSTAFEQKKNMLDTWAASLIAENPEDYSGPGGEGLASMAAYQIMNGIDSGVDPTKLVMGVASSMTNAWQMKAMEMRSIGMDPGPMPNFGQQALDSYNYIKKSVSTAAVDEVAGRRGGASGGWGNGTEVAPSGLPQVRTQEDYDKLKSGDEYWSVSSNAKATKP